MGYSDQVMVASGQRKKSVVRKGVLLHVQVPPGLLKKVLGYRKELLGEEPMANVSDAVRSLLETGYAHRRCDRGASGR